jgi:3-hydroxyisobutyrate dehydrogenase
MSGAGILGLGAMGQGMARSILRAGIPLKGFDLYEKSRAQFEEAGGQTGEDVSVLAGCDTLLVMVANAEQVEAGLFTGVLDALAPGGLVILCSTIAPSDVRAFAKRVADTGRSLLDAPVSGGQAGADAGALTIMASGAARDFERAAPLLEAMSKVVHNLGDEPGLGATYKVVHQLAAGVHLVAAAELLAFGQQAGCDPKRLFDIVSGAAGQSWMLNDRGPRMLSPGDDVTSAVDIFIKDLGLVVQTALEAGADVPLAEAAYDKMQRAKSMGFGRADDSAVIRAYGTGGEGQ